MADCYSGNLHVILAPDSKMTRIACWSHARRKDYECQHLDREASNRPLALMNQLYDIERRASQWTAEARGESIITHRRRGTAKLEKLLPDRWRANHPQAVREYREQERRDKADVASFQAAKRRARSELRKKK
jgi:hypothetical protein